ncbi:MAG: hypothetical protein RLZZ499_1146, partial [Cyanobacteriota bacterium]
TRLQDLGWIYLDSDTRQIYTNHV